ncbi:shieldin complex subunit 3 [Kryptolebias marmoratus]|uniref:Shieldin complex subunit 3 n=1 Tax=Kryptolebias marmoratus TaxID=37003 RepID=A0A3Q3AF13_KRYMA|nr:shieldin complex subunit 3 [Kryptolebias marmoratus]
MEDVILHYQPGSADGLSSLLQTTERLLEPFTRRPPPVFKPWFPTSPGDHRLPLRPAKPAPRITSAADLLTVTTCQTENKPQRDISAGSAAEVYRACAESPPEKTERETTAPSPTTQPQTDTDVSPVRRSWSVFTQRRVLLQSSLSLSKRFRHVVSVQGLHLRQRAKWVITEDNCRDIEKVWRSLSRSVRSSSLPTCNANIQRERAEIWVFCDVLYSEQVGRFLKDELQLSGRISLSVHKLGNIFSL